MDWNHGIFGLAPLPGDANGTPRVSTFHGSSGYFDGGADGLSWSPGVNIWDPAKGNNPSGFFEPYSPRNGYATWQPVDEPYAFFSNLLVAPYVSELTMSYVFPVDNEATPRFRICQMGNRTNHVLDGCDASPDGTKIIFNSDTLMAGGIYYVVARLPDRPLNAAAAESSGNVDVTWLAATHSKEVAGYNVYRSGDSGYGYSQINASLVTDLSFTDTTADTGSTYFYVVTSVEHSELEGTYSDEAAYGAAAATAERTIFAEAEAGSWDTGFWKGFYGTCSDLYYIWKRTGGGTATATVPMDVPRSDDYYVWARIKDGTVTIEGEAITTTESQWTWVRSTFPVTLLAGLVDIDATATDYGSAIDAIYLTTDTSFTPVGMNSMDIHSPDQLTGLAGTPDGSFGVDVSWTASGAADLHHYNLYIGTSAGFTCDSETLIASPASTSHLDWQLSAGTTYYYKVTAVDRQGNESTPSIAASVTTAGLSIVTLDQAVSFVDANTVTATVNVPTSGSYRLWIKFDKNNTTNGRVYVKRDSLSPVTWQWAPDDTVRAQVDTWLTYGTQSVYTLSAGSHTFSIECATSTITDIKVTNDMSWRPPDYFVSRFGW